MLALDLFVLHRRAHQVSLTEAVGRPHPAAVRARPRPAADPGREGRAHGAPGPGVSVTAPPRM
jgi:hypothetical protein